MSEPDLQSPKLILDLSHATSVESLHEILAAALLFPSYYGQNWDAFWDCISGPDQSSMPAELIIRGFSMVEERFPRDAAILKKCLVDMQVREDRFVDPRPGAKPTKVVYEETTNYWCE